MALAVEAGALHFEALGRFGDLLVDVAEERFDLSNPLFGGGH